MSKDKHRLTIVGYRWINAACVADHQIRRSPARVACVAGVIPMPLTRVPIRIVADPPAHSILITQGAGYVGHALALSLTENPDIRVTCLDRRQPDPALSTRPNFRFVKGDLTDRARVAMVLVEQRVDKIINLAAECPATDDAEARRSLIATNVVGVQQLLDVALDYWRRLPGDYRARFRLVHLSSADVFGSAPFDGRRFDETAPYWPSTPYAASKAAADHLVRTWHTSFGLPTLIATAGTIYGPGQSRNRFVPGAIAAAFAGEPINVLGTGAHTRDWIHIDDVIAALSLICLRGPAGETFLIGGRDEHCNVAVAAMICDMVDRVDPWPDGRKRRSLIRFVADRPGHDHRQALDPSRMERELGWRATIDFRDGLAAIIERYRAETGRVAGGDQLRQA